jgi:hypothetical protein
MARLDKGDEEIRKRVESSEYLRLVKKCFRDWSAAESEEKRRLIRNLLSNAAATKICTDDVISMFISWIDIYSEPHFAVIREIYKSPGTTRQQIWDMIHGVPVREDSAEADLFKLLVHDLMISNLRGEVGEVIISWVLLRYMMAKERELSSDDIAKDMRTRAASS